MNRKQYFETISPALGSARRELLKHVEQLGWEFPDACYKVATKHGFMVEELRRAYDDYFDAD